MTAKIVGYLFNGHGYKLLHFQIINSISLLFVPRKLSLDVSSARQGTCRSRIYTLVSDQIQRI